MTAKDLEEFKKMAETEQLTNPTVLIAGVVGIVISIAVGYAVAGLTGAILRQHIPDISEGVLALIVFPNLLPVMLYTFLPIIGIQIASRALRRRIDAEIAVRNRPLPTGGSADEATAP